MKKIFTICFIIFIFIILKFNFVYHVIQANLKFIKWKKKYVFSNPENLSKIKKKINSESGVSYYNRYPIDDMYFDLASFYEKEIIDKTYNSDYSNPLILGKSDSLLHKIGLFTNIVNFMGEKQGDSIFRMDLEKRKILGKYDRKEAYLQALKPSDLEKYRQKIRKYLKEKIILDKSFYLDAWCHQICSDLFILLHFNTSALDTDYEDINIFLEAVINFPFTRVNDSSFLKQVNNLKSFYQKFNHSVDILKKNPQHCIINSWLDTNLSQDDIFIEYIHNILAMVVNWFNTLYPYLLGISEKKIPRFNKKNNNMDSYIHECYRFISPATYASSLIKNPAKFRENIKNNPKLQSQIKDNGYYLHLYDLKVQNHHEQHWGEDSKTFKPNRFRDLNLINKSKISKCPFSINKTNNNAMKFSCQTLVEKKGYLPFGEGYRRCPGEFLSMIFLEEIVEFIKDKNVKIELLNDESITRKYIWDTIETNYQITLTVID